MQRLQDASKERLGRIEYQRTGWYFDGTRILIIKPTRLGEWTRTAALNDAAEIHAEITAARRRRMS